MGAPSFTQDDHSLGDSQFPESLKKQIHFTIPGALHMRFKLKTVIEERTMRQVMEELIRQYVDDN